MTPASIRYRNPGAMWGSPLAIKWGANKNPVALNDGLKQNNNIAVFPNYTLGIAAQQDLWRTSSRYRGKRFEDAIRTWSGGNYVDSYIHFVQQHVPGITRDTIMDDAFWRGPMGEPFLKAQAWHEAGQQYPATEAEWQEGRRRALAGVVPATVAREATKPHVAAAAAGATTAATGAVGGGTTDHAVPPAVTYGVAGLGVALVAVAVVMLVRKRTNIFANAGATGDDHDKEEPKS